MLALICHFMMKYTKYGSKSLAYADNVFTSKDTLLIKTLLIITTLVVIIPK